MNWLDVVLLVLIALSFVSGLVKGLIREVLSLGGVILGILAAILFAPQLSPGLERWIPVPSAAYATALILVFLAVMLAAELVARFITRLVKFVKLGPINHLLGGAFGLLRGLLITIVLVLGIALYLEPGQKVLARSQVVPYLSWGARGLSGLLPPATRRALDERLDRLDDVSNRDTI